MALSLRVRHRPGRMEKVVELDISLARLEIGYWELSVVDRRSLECMMNANVQIHLSYLAFSSAQVRFSCLLSRNGMISWRLSCSAQCIICL